MKLYEFGPTRSIRARWTLQELGVDFEPVTVNLTAGEHRRPEFLEINPAGKLPVLVDGDLVLTESVAITLYLAEKYPDRGLVPADLKQRAQVNRWLLFTATELEQPLWDGVSSWATGSRSQTSSWPIPWTGPTWRSCSTGSRSWRPTWSGCTPDRVRRFASRWPWPA